MIFYKELQMDNMLSLTTQTLVSTFLFLMLNTKNEIFIFENWLKMFTILTVAKKQT